MLKQERMLLWSLGINEQKVDDPHVVILYGRGRRCGALLKGEEITTNKIFNILSIIGADCECRLDRYWILGTSIPIRWGAEIQTEAVRCLGFDSENPIIKNEMKQILSMGPSLRPQDERFANPVERDVFGYAEEIVEFRSSSDVPRISMSQLYKPDSRQSTSFKISSAFQITLFIVGSIFLIVLIGALLILVRAKRRASQ